MKFKYSFFTALIILSSCTVGPEYEKPKIKIIDSYKNTDIIWKYALAQDDIDRGKWWKIYNDSTLNDLMDKLNNNNQDIVSAAYSYKEALAIVEQSKASFYPSIDANSQVTSQKTSSSNSSKDLSFHSAGLSSSWEMDLWGSVRYSVASDVAAAQSSKAYLASTKLSSQSSLAQYYYNLRGLDIDQDLLDNIVKSNEKILNYTKNRYKSGIVDNIALLNAENDLQTAKSNSSNNKINRAQYENAIAVLIGESASSFNIAPIPMDKKTFAFIPIPINLPSKLLERRPDIVQAEKLVKQANAQIGIAKTAFFPSLSLNASLSMQGSTTGNLLSMPTMIWSLGPQLTQNLFDGGLRKAQTKAAWATYEQTVASYKSTILNAFSEVENQLSAIKLYEEQDKMLKYNVENQKKLLNITTNQYKEGIVDYSQILTSQINYYNAKKYSADIESLRRSSEIMLIKALGGGWRED